MGTRLRRFALLAVASLNSLAIPAAAQGVDEHVACWYEVTTDVWTGSQSNVTRCRLAGGEVIDYRDDREVPVVLRPNLGSDLVGACWFYTSRATPYVVVTLYANGDALIGYIPDPDNPGSWIAVEVYRRCTSEPEEESDRETRVWEYAHSYIHRPPVPSVSPRVGDGIAGLATYVGTVVPPQHDATLAGGTATLDIEIEVSAVIVNWGDDTTVQYPPDGRMLAGYPNGAAWHIYQAKTGDLTISVSYRWSVRWRANGGPWATLTVPDTTTTVDYPVAEVVSVLGN